LFALFAGLIASSMIPSPTDMLFPVHAVPAPGPLPARSRPLMVPAADGVTLHGVHISPVREAGKPVLILGFGGNAWNGSDVAAYLHRLYPDAQVVAFHYRGYRPSTGTPSADALLADAPLVRAFADKEVKADFTIAVGFSIGSGVAAGLAKEGLVDGAILVTPFDSLKAAAADLFPWLPVSLFFNQEINAAALLAQTEVPVAIIAGERDTLIRPARTEGLRKSARNLVFDRTIVGAGHNDIYERPEFFAAMREARDKLIRNSIKKSDSTS
jgi:pimeloyl-ACP methyl ester carboxylesterase